MNTQVRNAYPDEQKKLEEEAYRQEVVWREIEKILRMSGFDLEVRFVNKWPRIALVRA